MKTTLLMLTTFCSLNLFAGGVHCKSCPAESDACMPKADCHIQRNNSCTFSLNMGKMAICGAFNNRSTRTEAADLSH